MLELSFFSPLFLSLGYILYLLLGNKYPQAAALYVTPAIVMPSLFLELACRYSGVFTGALMSSYAAGGSLPVLRVLAVTILIHGIASYFVSRTYGANTWLPIIFFGIAFYLRFAAYTQSEFPVAYGNYILLSAVASIVPLFACMILGGFLSNSQDTGTHRMAIAYLLIYIPVVFVIENAVAKEVFKFNGKNWALQSVKAKTRVAADNKSVPPRYEYILPDNRVLNGNNVFNKMEYPPEEVTLFFDPKTPDQYTFAPLRLRPVSLREFFGI
jgi:hypothetical protein